VKFEDISVIGQYELCKYFNISPIKFPICTMWYGVILFMIHAES